MYISYNSTNLSFLTFFFYRRGLFWLSGGAKSCIVGVHGLVGEQSFFWKLRMKAPYYVIKKTLSRGSPPSHPRLRLCLTVGLYQPKTEKFWPQSGGPTEGRGAGLHSQDSGRHRKIFTGTKFWPLVYFVFYESVINEQVQEVWNFGLWLFLWMSYRIFMRMLLAESNSIEVMTFMFFRTWIGKPVRS